MKSTPSTGASCAPLRTLSTPNRRRVRTYITGDSLTRQEHMRECDINEIMKRYQRTGALTHFATYAPEYGDFNACDYQESLNLITRANQMFADLPSSIRAEVGTVQGFLTFVQDPKNKPRMEQLGLIKAETVPVPPPGGPGPAPEPSQGA